MTNKRILKLRELIKNKIPQDVVTLDPIKHVYTNRDDLFLKYVSTTTKLKVISNPIWAEWRMNRMAEWIEANPFNPKVEPWKDYIRKAKQYPEDLFKEAGERGTLVHDYANKYFRDWIKDNKKPESILTYVANEKDTIVWSALRSLEAWVNKSDYIPLASELVLWNDDLGIAGTMDNVGVIGNDIVGIDLKTSNNLREDYELQLSDYAEMFWSFTKIRLRYGVVVKLDKDYGQEDDFDLVPDLKTRYKTYLHASNLYDDMQIIREERKKIKQKRINI